MGKKRYSGRKKTAKNGIDGRIEHREGREKTKMESREQYLEGIAHVTRTSPYSIHKISFSRRKSPALYMHLHPEMELLYLEKGELVFQIEGEDFAVREGDAVFIPANLLHMAKAVSADGLFRALVFASEYLASSMEQRYFQKYVCPVSQGNFKLALVLKREIPWQCEAIEILKRVFTGTESFETPDLLISGYLLALWQYLYQHHFSQVIHNGQKNQAAEQMEETVSYLQTHYREDISLETLARAVHLSKGQLCRSFRQQTGTTPFTYLKKYRVLKSCIYLADTDKKISEICMLCGFNNISYFNREFLKIMKTTPSEYRRQSIEYAASKRNLLTYSEDSFILKP